MKKVFGLLFVLLLSSLSRAQDTMICDNFKDGEDSVTICESDDYKSVMRCKGDGSGCSSTSGKKPIEQERSDESLRKFCTDGLDSFCVKLADKVRSRDRLNKKIGNPCDVETHQSENCKQEAEESKLNDEVVDKYLAKEEAKRAVLTLDLCEKKVYDKPYCDEFKKKLEAKAHAHATAQPTQP